MRLEGECLKVLPGFLNGRGSNEWYHFGVGAPPMLVNLSGDWDVHWAIIWILTHSQIFWEDHPLSMWRASLS